MAKQKISIWQYICERCEHKWLPRDAESDEPKLPRVCPKCKSPYWNSPRKDAKVSNTKVKKAKL